MFLNQLFLILQITDVYRITATTLSALSKRHPAKILLLASQSKPCNIKFILDAYMDAVKPKKLIKTNDEGQGFNYGYFIFNFNLSQPEIQNYMTNIFPDEMEPVTVYREIM